MGIHLLVDDEGDEEAELGDLGGDGLDVHAVDAVLDEVEFAGEVEGVVAGVEGFLDVGDAGVAIGDLVLVGAGFLEQFAVAAGLARRSRFQRFVVGVELLQEVHEAVERAHGEGAGAAGGVEDFYAADGGDEGVAGVGLDFVEAWPCWRRGRRRASLQRGYLAWRGRT